MKRKFITFTRIVRTGFVNFFRNLSLAIAAVAVMVVTLTIILLSVLINTTLSSTISQITDKIDVSVYLVDDVTPQQLQQFTNRIEALPNVKDTSYLSKEQALEAYKADNAGNTDLLTAINQTDNPLPATIRIKPVDLDKVEEIRSFLEQDQNKKLQSEEPSYSGDRKEAIDKISHAARVLQQVGIGGVVLFALVSVLIIFNTIQMAIFNRRDEIGIMRLLGASTHYIRGPFIVESIMYGVIAAAISISLIQLLFAVSSSTLEASSLGLLDIAAAHRYFQEHFLLLLTLQLTIGIVIGAASSAIATKRYLKFKTTKK